MKRLLLFPEWLQHYNYQCHCPEHPMEWKVSPRGCSAQHNVLATSQCQGEAVDSKSGSPRVLETPDCPSAKALHLLLPDHGGVGGSPVSVGTYGSISVPEQQGQTLSSRTWSADKGLTYQGYLFHKRYQRMPLSSYLYFAFVLSGSGGGRWV